MSLRSYNLQHLGCMLFLGYVFLYDLIEKVLGYWAALIIVFAGLGLCFMAIQKGEDRYRLSRAFAAGILPWTALLVLFVIPRNYRLMDHNYWSTIRWCAAVIMMILVAYKPVCYKGILKIILFFSALHVAATWIFYFVPTLYEGFYKLWGSWPVGTEKNFAVYRAGITNNYSRSAIAMIPGFLVLAAVMLVIVLGSGTVTRINTGRLIAACAAFAVVLGALVLNAKRSTLLFGMAAIALGFVTYKYRKINVVRTAGIGILAIAAVLVLSNFVAPLQTVVNRFLQLGKDTSTTNRLRMWKLALEMFMRRPLVGNGWQSFVFEYYDKLSNKTGGLYDYLDAHNVYLQVLAETGLIGFGLFMTGIVITFMTAYRMIQVRDRIPGFFDRTAVVYSFMYQIYFILYCATGNCLYDITFTHYMVAAGLALGVYVKTILSQRQVRETYETNRYFDLSQSI